MRKIVLGLAVSLDGYIEGPNGEYDWCFTDQDYGLNEFFTRIDSIFVGRKTYEMALAGDGQESWLPKMREYIFSTTLTEADISPKKTLISGDIEARVKAIKNQKGKDIWLFGGAELTNTLMNLGLVDEIWLSIHPIILGAGKPLFSSLKERRWLTLTDSKVYETGLVSLKYDCKWDTTETG
ncbi:dihydrofolate reductase family protein [Runella salmonicolor]|uniref:Dihydrofolate reductase family protein n=1 Tax=Runella salmonicolor TaxID=2950278 RepID=A0ABT1FRZ7_9BACT|nr:dihydrofolate reductase family protein [Runella salmonicolor]MCP1383548.1 dihydrofolate reductase family protein [Runella salmonicolor]